MDRGWAVLIESFGHSPNFPMWLTLAAAVFLTIILLMALFRAEQSVANGVLAVITLFAMGIAVTAMSSRPLGANRTDQDDAKSSLSVSLPALSCLDGLAGESVETACEKVLFASPDSTAAAVSYSAAQILRLSSFGNAAAADDTMTPELQTLRRTIERDRFGLIAQVLMVREGCVSRSCPFFQFLSNSTQISANMSERFYDGLIGRYASIWNIPASSLQAGNAPVAILGGINLPSGKPVSGDFPSSASIPPVNIMTPESVTSGVQSAPRNLETPTQPAPRAAQSIPAPAPRPASVAPATPKKPPAPKARAQAPVPLAPSEESDDN
jgi:hypothetical protein